MTCNRRLHIDDDLIPLSLFLFSLSPLVNTDDYCRPTVASEIMVIGGCLLAEVLILIGNSDSLQFWFTAHGTLFKTKLYVVFLFEYTKNTHTYKFPKQKKKKKKKITYTLSLSQQLCRIAKFSRQKDSIFPVNKLLEMNSTTTRKYSSDIIKPRDVCIVGVARTPIGDFLGSLSSLSATQLGAIAIKSALKRAGVDPSQVQEVFFGNVLSANLGQAPARQAALGAGIPNSVICTTINKVCSSGMKATMLAAQTIQLGSNDVVVAGGMESMSNTPKYLTQARSGSRLGHDSVIDGMLKDGLWDVYNDFGMGVCAELCADQHSIPREEQDAHAIQSFERGISAQQTGAFGWEITPVTVSGGKGKPVKIIEKDESLGKFDPLKLRNLRPSFKKGGSVTAGNASIISDGAAALVLVSGEKALELGLQVIAKIRGFADAAQAPELFPTAPALAIPKAISNAGLEASNIDYYEINEAFSVVALANQKLLGLNPEKVNVNGGAVSLGHPLGCSGARILVTLLGVLRQRSGTFGVGGICNGGGGASALVLELMPSMKIRRSSL